MSAIEVGGLIYEYPLKITGVTEYGVSFAELMAGCVEPSGKVRGVDDVQVRADGRFGVHIHAEITAADGPTISLHADGVCRPRTGSSIADHRENVTLFTSAKEYSWVNTLQIWASGTVDLAEQLIQLKGYSA